MKVRRERPSQRLHHRVSAPVLIDMPEGTFVATDWSLGGFGIEGYKGGAMAGDEVACTLHLPFQGFDIAFPVKIRIVRVVEDGGIGVEFTEVGDREHELMAHFVDDLVRGTMTNVGDTILRIDSPVTPVSTKPDPNQGEAIPVKRWSWKVFAMTGFYFSAGLAVLVYAGLVFTSNFLRLEVDTAVVSAPMEPVLASTDGRVKMVNAAAGQFVRREDTLMTIEDPKLQQAIELAKIQVDRLTMNLIARQKELKAEKEKLRDYQSVAINELSRMDAKIRALEEQVSLVGNQVRRFNKLLDEGWTTRSKLDEIEAEYARLSGKLQEARLLRRERQKLLGRIGEGRYFTGEKFEGRTQELQAAVDLAWDEVMLAKDELVALQRRLDRLVLAAPTNGRIIKLLKSVGSTVRHGEQVALFERDEARIVEAFLTQEEVLEIGLGDEAWAYFPSLDTRVRVFVTDIDRTTGYVDEMGARYQWRGPKDRSARISLIFADLPPEVIRRRFLPGLPVVVTFSRRETSEVGFRIKDGIKRAFKGERT
ncbi:MAG: PilZ domain-containing protein [Rhodospirillales bacterium]|nr:PilZ domain-containing protein [Rhodospirillales bacterium]